MAIAATAPTSGPSLAGPSLSGGSLANGPLPLPRARDRWTYMVNAGKLHCVRGEIVPSLAKAWHTPGLNGNGAALGRGEGYMASMVADGWTAIPHNFDCVAFGESRASAPLSAYLDRYEGVAQGRGVVYHSDAWSRPRRIGHLVTWDRDHDGWADFLRRCLALVTPGDLDPMQIAIAVEPLAAGIRGLLDRDDARGRRLLAQHLTHMPTEHCPPDLVEVLEAHNAATAATATRRRGAKK